MGEGASRVATHAPAFADGAGRRMIKLSKKQAVPLLASTGSTHAVQPAGTTKYQAKCTRTRTRTGESARGSVAR
eukprot:scaffold102444_cov30-Prasinocladus_malaysianus.AAC.1